MSTTAIKPEVFDEAARLLERGWCQDDFALDQDGFEVAPNDPGAVCWCGSGALMAVLDIADENETTIPIIKPYTTFMLDFVEQYLPKPSYSANLWPGGVSDHNDDDETTQETMVEWMRLSGEYARERS